MSASNQKGSMQKTLSLWNFFTIGFGAIIGTGWVLMVGDWMIIGGGPVAAMIAFIIGAVFLLPIGAVFGELTAAIPISGGIVEYCRPYLWKYHVLYYRLVLGFRQCNPLSMGSNCYFNARFRYVRRFISNPPFN